MMEGLRAVLLVLAVCTADGNAASIPEEGELVHIQLVRHQADEQRVMRDAGPSAMPDLLVFNFRLGQQDVILRLQRVRYPPLYLLTEEGAEEATGLDSGVSSVYVDPSRAASFKVYKFGAGLFHLDGSLKHQGEQLVMRPSSRSKRSADDDSSHVLTKMALPAPKVIEFEHGDPTKMSPKQGPQSNGSWSRVRRKRQAGVEQHVVETAFVIDHTDYAAWKTKYPTDTLTELRDYYTYVGQTLNNIYASVMEESGDLDIKVAVTAFYLVMSSGNAIIVEPTGVLEGKTYLNDFISWIPTQASLPRADHYMAFTQYDVLFHEGPAVGVAELAAMCTADSVSVVENSFEASVANVAAHEMGHSLAASHDKAADGCPSNLKNVMTPVFSVPTDDSTSPRNVFTFSACSIDSFRQYLDGVTCTRPEYTSATPALPFSGFGNDLITDRDQQCRLATNDSDSYMCDPAIFSNYEEADICIGMLCRVPADDPQRLRCTYVLPYEGTSCGTDLICSRGLCVDQASVVQASVTFGTDASTITTAATTLETATSEAPTTPAPTTPPPTTPPPTTPPPTTPAPTTPEPTTPAPTTPTPTTPEPTTPAPTTPTPTTPEPTTPAPTTPTPTTPEPTTPTPTTPTPTTPEPTTPAPTTPEPTTPTPTTPTPTTPEPTTPTPTTPEPTTPAPTTPEPTTPTPTTPTPTTPTPTTPTPTTPEPTTPAPTTPEPTTPTPTTPTPTTPTPTTPTPTTPTPTTPTPTTPEPTTPEPTTPTPTTTESATTSPTTETAVEASTSTATVPTRTRPPCCCRCRLQIIRCMWEYVWWIFYHRPVSPCCRTCLATRRRRHRWGK